MHIVAWIAEQILFPLFLLALCAAGVGMVAAALDNL